MVFHLIKPKIGGNQHDCLTQDKKQKSESAEMQKCEIKISGDHKASLMPIPTTQNPIVKDT